MSDVPRGEGEVELGTLRAPQMSKGSKSEKKNREECSDPKGLGR